MAKRTRISIDYGLCGDGTGVDPRKCGLCMRACGPAVFLMHQTMGAEEADPCDPKAWRVTPLWASLCTSCMKCVEACPCRAVRVNA